jgi:hypothetical protein
VERVDMPGIQLARESFATHQNCNRKMTTDFCLNPNISLPGSTVMAIGLSDIVRYRRASVQR